MNLDSSAKGLSPNFYHFFSYVIFITNIHASLLYFTAILSNISYSFKLYFVL
jgi:hypothetical protein